MKHATDHWRKQFRGDAPVKDDTEITDADIANSNLVLWGDPMSNACSRRSRTSCRSSGPTRA